MTPTGDWENFGGNICCWERVYTYDEEQDFELFYTDVIEDYDLDMTSVVEWLKADAITGVTDGNPISTWQHSAGFDLTAATTARPTYVAGSQNGLPVARFNGTSNIMTQTIGFSTLTQPFTIAMASF